MIKKFSAPCTLGYQGIKIWSLLFKNISLQGNALSPPLFQLSYPFKIEGLFPVPQVFVCCLCDIFIPQRWDFSFGNRSNSEGAISGEYGAYQENMGDEEGISNPHSVAAVMATCDVWVGVLSCKSRTQQVSFPRLFFAISWCIHLNPSA